MRSPQWAWVGAKETGSSHIKAGAGCDDFGACVEILTCEGPVLVAVASDGAGSASCSFKGSRVVTAQMVRSIKGWLQSGGKLNELENETVSSWIDSAREFIYQSAKREGRSHREFAATLVAALVSPVDAAFIHIGDGAAVIRPMHEGAWLVPSWPMQGEYASTTYFVTDDTPNINLVYVSKRIDAIAVFTDGIERLVLDFKAKEPSQPFFDKMLLPLNNSPPGRNRLLSKRLQQYLASEAVLERTDDDKTVILARRLED